MLHAIWAYKPLRRLRGLYAAGGDERVEASKGFIERTGGTTIFVFKFARLDGVLALLVLMVYSALKSGWSFPSIALVTTVVRDLTSRRSTHAQQLPVDQTYAAILAVLNAFFPAQKGLVFSSHLSLVTFALLALYAYRNIWPLMTFTLEPIDSAEGNILWAKLILLAFVGALEPLLEPYPYIPYDATVS